MDRLAKNSAGLILGRLYGLRASHVLLGVPGSEGSVQPGWFEIRDPHVVLRHFLADLVGIQCRPPPRVDEEFAFAHSMTTRKSDAALARSPAPGSAPSKGPPDYLPPLTMEQGVFTDTLRHFADQHQWLEVTRLEVVYESVR